MQCFDHRLAEELKQQPWPRSILVLFRFALLGTVDDFHQQALSHFILALEAALPQSPIEAELFFIPLQVPNAVVLSEEVNLTTHLYEEAGYLGYQSLLPRAQYPGHRTWLNAKRRKFILQSLLQSGRPVTVKEYQRACRDLVSRRQAQRDLLSVKGLVRKGYTRNRLYCRAGS